MPRLPNPHVARPACGRHPRSRVVFDGTYGTPGHRRQRYKCFPEGERPHVFTDLLPRQRPHSGECLHCERPIAAHEGPPTPRGFHFSTKEIAAALVELGKGRSYREVAAEARLYAHRMSGGSGVLDNRLAGDWVELFAPALALEFTPRTWPRSVAVDSAPFMVSTVNQQGNPVQGGTPAFSVFAATEHQVDGTRELNFVALLRSYPGRHTWQQTDDWIDFFNQLEGMPERIVCDGQRDIVRAIERVWPASKGPTPTVWHCHYHLKERLLDRLRSDGVVRTDPLYHAGEQALFGPFYWRQFLAAASQHRLPATKRWLKTWEQTVTFQVANQRGLTLSTGGVEQKLQVIEHSLAPRRGRLTNRERLNRLLTLIQLQENRVASVPSYAKIIRLTLEANNGHAGRRHLIDDRRRPSLRP